MKERSESGPVINKENNKEKKLFYFANLFLSAFAVQVAAARM